ncbi:1,3-beta-glucanosyltransferase gel4 [Smittium culicis]|uniref:1,3-beta-glucanosyltransferase n=1 Tax=Smittium culicis TaxID=133412 RepID=A0A1R1YCG0_9FUNG|nr:1,3-beta-glucanosyltransferase gel4 [Smittium culicis]
MIKYFYCVLFSTLVYSIDPIVIKGSKFFNKNTNEQFFFKGVDYQPRQHDSRSNLDPLSENDACLRDVKLLKELNVNSIRVYETDYTLNHDVCMKALADAGIYVMLDIATPNYSINREAPTWDDDLYTHFKKKVDAFIGYPNVIAFLIGNEVTNDKNTTPASAFVKAALRDMKTYLKAKKSSIYIGYADNDDEIIRYSLIKYFNCGDDPMARVDFYGVNTYRWCGDKVTYETSGYASMAEPFQDYSVPVLLTEYGCNTARPRTFNEVAAVYSDKMTGIFSGGFIYEYSQEDNDYGLVKIDNGNAKKLDDFMYLKKQYAVKPSTDVTLSNYVPTGKIADCPPVAPDWKVSPRSLPPTPVSSFCNCVNDSLKCSVNRPKGSIPKEQGKSLGKVFDYICGTMPCNETLTNTETGSYGSISFCDPVVKAGFLINKKFIMDNENPASCSFNSLELSINKSPSINDIAACSKFNKDSDLSNISSNKKDSDQKNTKKSAANLLSSHYCSFVAPIILVAISVILC